MNRLCAAAGLVVAVSVFGGASAAQGAAQTASIAKPKLPPEPTFNLFSPAQDIAIGVASAKEADRQLRMYIDPPLEAYLNRVVTRLAAFAPGAKYPYYARIVDAPEVNAFSMPGGPIFVSRGVLLEAQTEPEVAAVLAHEMAHIALRHGTDHASKIYLGKSGLGILGGLRGNRSREPEQMINEVGGVGLNLAFLKFLDDDEYDADGVGARMLAQAGYDPNVLAVIQARVRKDQQRDSANYRRYFEDHPPGRSREERLRGELGALSLKPAAEIGGFGELHARLAASPFAKVIAHPWPSDSAGPKGKKAEPVVIRLPQPSARQTTYQHRTGFFTVTYPADWLVRDSTPGFGVTIAPMGGIIDLPNGAQTVVHGMVINHYAPFEGEQGRLQRSAKQFFAPLNYTKGRRGVLEDATDDLVRLVLWTNPYLEGQTGSARTERIDGAPGYSVVLTGLSPLTGEEERVLVFTRALPDDHIVFALCVAGARDYELLEPLFKQIVKSLSVNESVVHKPTNIVTERN